MLGALLAPGAAHADAVTQWNTYASNAFFTVAGQPPQQSVPHLAMVHGAIYDAVNAIDRDHEGYLLTSRVATPFDSKDAAAATAAYRVLAEHRAGAEAHARRAVRGVAGGRSQTASPKTRGIAVGEAAAAAMIAARTDDGRFGPFRFTSRDDTRRVAAGTPDVRERPERLAEGREAVPDPERFALPVEGAAPLDEPCIRARVRRGEVARLDVQHPSGPPIRRYAARYWAENPPATWSRIFRTLSAQQEVSVVDNARLFAMLYLTAADSLICIWDGKAYWSFWRPITAIREADTDGNPKTVQDECCGCR